MCDLASKVRRAGLLLAGASLLAVAGGVAQVAAVHADYEPTAISTSVPLSGPQDGVAQPLAVGTAPGGSRDLQGAQATMFAPISRDVAQPMGVTLTVSGDQASAASLTASMPSAS